MRIKRECFNLEVTGFDKQRNGEGSYSKQQRKKEPPEPNQACSALCRTVRGELGATRRFVASAQSGLGALGAGRLARYSGLRLRHLLLWIGAWRANCATATVLLGLAAKFCTAKACISGCLSRHAACSLMKRNNSHGAVYCLAACRYFALQ